MLLRCNPGCKLSDGTTEGSLDPDTEEVICKNCSLELTNVASFTKRSMKSSGDVIKKDGKAFIFDCKTCKKKVETSVVDGELKGLDCEKDCQFNVSRFMINSMKSVGTNDDEESGEA